MLRYLKLLILIPLGAAIIGLAVINRATTRLVYWPEQLGGELSLSMPLFAALMAALILGVMIGSTATWLAQGRHRRAERQFRREAERLKTESNRLKAMQPADGIALPMLKGS